MAFCGAILPSGPCNGLGTCVLAGAPSYSPTCICQPDTYNVNIKVVVGKTTITYPSCSSTAPPSPPPSPPPGPPPSRNPGVNYNKTDTTDRGSYFNKYFRYASKNFVGTATAPSWNLTQVVDWRSPPGSATSAVQTVKDQGACLACWALAPITAMESAYAIVYSIAPPNASAQMVVNCQGTWSCSGGWPADAFNYIASSRGVPDEASMPYTGVYNASSCPKGESRRSRTLRGLEPVLWEERIAYLLHSHRRSALSHSSRALRTDTITAQSYDWNPLTPREITHPLTTVQAATSSSSGASSRARSRASSRANSLPSQSKLSSASRSSPSLPSIKATSVPGAPWSIAMYEQVIMFGWTGMALAVQNQPVVAFVEADQPSFTAFTGVSGGGGDGG